MRLRAFVRGSLVAVAGAAVVFRRAPSGWQQEILLKASQPGSGDRRDGRGGRRHRGRARYLVSMLPASSNTGRYIATIRPPTTTPRNAIMIGSIKAVMPATATSTSSS